MLVMIRIKTIFFKIFIFLIIFTNLFIFYKLITSHNALFYENKLSLKNFTIYKKSNNCNPFHTSIKFNRKIKINRVAYPKIELLHTNDSIDFDCLNKNNFIKTILIWNKYFGSDLYLGKIEPFKKNGCPVWNCEVTLDKSKFEQSDIVFVHVLDKFDPMPKYKPKYQRWILGEYESPFHSGDLTKYNGYFNLTSSYRLNSDFPEIYGPFNEYYWDVTNESRGLNVDEIDFTTNRTKIAFALISNCKAPSRRFEYINELKKYIKIDLYGNCGEKCPIKDCKKYLSSEYKFVLAFENSVCNDYVTEKFFDALKLNLVPVVLGGANYDLYVPISAYINALDFKTPQDLANYLTYLDKNNTAYNEYFKWKKHIYYDETRSYSIYCDICIKLHLEAYTGIEEKVLNNIEKDFLISSNCKKSLVKNTNNLFQYKLIDIVK